LLYLLQCWNWQDILSEQELMIWYGTRHWYEVLQRKDPNFGARTNILRGGVTIFWNYNKNEKALRNYNDIQTQKRTSNFKQLQTKGEKSELLSLTMNKFQCNIK